MNLYNVALFIHVTAVTVLFASITLDLTMVLGMGRSRTVEMVRTWASLTSVVEKSHPVALVGIVSSGVYMVVDSWGWGTAWVDVALVSVVIMATLGITVSGRRLTDIYEAATTAPGGALSQSLQNQIEDPMLRTVTQNGVFVAVGIVGLMTLKPNLLGSLATMTVAVAFGLASTAPIWRRQGSSSLA